MTYLFGLDCGGTKIQAGVYNLAGEQIDTIVGGPSNLIVDYQLSLNNIRSVISQVADKYGIADCCFTLLGVAGIDSGDFRQQLIQDLTQDLTDFEVMNDGQLALWNKLSGKDGALLIAGTGSLILAKKDKNWLRVGGWGHLIGDEGSGYWIGLTAIKQMFDELDQQFPISLLSRELLKVTGAENPMALIKLVYQYSKTEIANLAAVVARVASTGEEVAVKILVEAGQLLAKQVVLLSDKLQEKSFNLGINGSIIEKNQFVQQSFYQLLREEQIEVFVHQSQEINAKAVLFYFKERNHK